MIAEPSSLISKIESEGAEDSRRKSYFTDTSQSVSVATAPATPRTKSRPRPPAEIHFECLLKIEAFKV